MRFLHLADVHLDTSFAGRDAQVRARLREATRQALKNAVELAIEERVHAVLVAGDLFDGARLSFETERLMVDELGRLGEARIPVVYVTGNHDPGSAARARRQIPWPDGVLVLAGPDPERIAIRGADGVQVGWVTGAGHASPAETRDLAARFPRGTGPLPEVALLHTQVVGSRDAESHEPYAPAALETLRTSGYDYWALGHVHVRQALSEVPGIHYPGNLQGRTPRETGPKGGLLVEVSRGSAPRVEFRPLAPVRWETLSIRDPAGATTMDGFLRLVQDRWTEARRGDPDPAAEWIVRVSVSGSTPLWRELEDPGNRAHLAEELEGALGVLQVGVVARGIHAPVSADEHMGREDVLGVALRLVADLRRGEAALEGLDEELAAPAGEGGPALDTLLEGAEEELVSRLLRREG